MTAQRSLPPHHSEHYRPGRLVGFLYMALVWAPPAANLQGAEQAAQRIFYIHMGNNATATWPFSGRFH